MEQKTYSNNDITIVWKPGTCIHSKLCWQGLLAVFNPKERPWIKMEGASTEAIIAQVNKCPSGALSYHKNTAETTAHETAGKENDLTITSIKVKKDGPYLVQSACKIIHADGTEEVKEGSFALCRCGASANKPFCDGSHRTAGFEG